MKIAQLGSPERPIRVGTRASQLARTQTEQVVTELRERGMNCEIVEIATQGDKDASSLAAIGGIGVFAAALRVALLENRCDLAVHSYKDLPTTLVPGLIVAAVPPRAPWDDVLVAAEGKSFDDLPAGASVGTGSPRRIAQLRAARPDLHYVDIRGNVGTRLGRVRGAVAGGAGDLEAVVLARAGLQRLHAEGYVTGVLPDLLPAPGQGALALECRSDDLSDPFCRQFSFTLRILNDPSTQLAAEAEREVLRYLEAGCAAPVGALASLEWNIGGAGRVRGTNVGRLSLTAAVLSLDGTERIEISGNTLVPLGSDQVESDWALASAQDLGVQVGAQLIEAGAAQITDLSATKALRRGVDNGDEESISGADTQSLWPAGTETPADADLPLPGDKG